jgi:uncharacterized protein
VISHDPPPSMETSPGRVEHLSRDECLELLESKRVGRVAYCETRGPVVLPVNFTVRSQSIVFRTKAGSRLAQHMNDAPATFQIDEIDDFLQSGWSVLVVGVAHWVTDTEDLSDLWWDQHQPQPWAEGERNAFVRIVPATITGRRVHPS